MLLLILLGFLIVCYSSVGKIQVSALGTGIGIREDGPSKAQVGDTISYVITVINLGDYWDRNLTVTDRFPNGTSKSWNIPDLAPLLQTGHQFTLSGIQYTIRAGDVLLQQPPSVVNNAKVAGYADVNGSRQLVQAETNWPTIVLFPPVAIFTVSDDHPLVNETVTFNASSSYDPDGHIAKYEWDWEGDGIFNFDAESSPMATHSYTSIGIYYPILRVTDNDSLTNETTGRIFVATPTIVVGGYSVQLETTYSQTTCSVYVVLLFAMTITSGCLGFRIKRHYKKRDHNMRRGSPDTMVAPHQQSDPESESKYLQAIPAKEPQS